MNSGIRVLKYIVTVICHECDLLVQISMGSGYMNEKKCYCIAGQCSPRENALEPLNVETPRDSKLWLTVAVDLVVRGIKEPVRLVLETQVKVFPASERFWSISRRPLIQQFTLNLKEVSNKCSVCQVLLLRWIVYLKK